MKVSVPFVLASGSPRRSDLLRATGFTFSIVKTDVNEDPIDGESVLQMVERLALLKATTAADNHPNSLVLGSDTTVELDGIVLGKPETRSNAIDMLTQLSGKRHTVHTSIALVHLRSNRSISCVESTEVTFATLEKAEIERYVETGSPMDKAGGYGIQDEGAFFVQKVSGDFYTVMGLPLHRLYRLLRTHFDDLIG